DNRTYGLTTLENRLVSITGDRIRMAFRGKSGIFQEYELTDPTLARLTRRCRELPGRFLFQYRDETGVHPVTADDVNAYLAEATQGVMTAKDFRVWRASVYAAARLASEPPDNLNMR